MTSPELLDFSRICGTCKKESPVYLEIWPVEREPVYGRLEEGWLEETLECESCFKLQILNIARYTEAVYHLPTCARVKIKITVSTGERILLEEGGS